MVPGTRSLVWCEHGHSNLRKYLFLPFHVCKPAIFNWTVSIPKISLFKIFYGTFINVLAVLVNFEWDELKMMQLCKIHRKSARKALVEA